MRWTATQRAGVSCRQQTPRMAKQCSSHFGQREPAVGQQAVVAEVDAERAEHMGDEQGEDEAGPAERAGQEGQQRHHVEADDADDVRPVELKRPYAGGKLQPAGCRDGNGVIRRGDDGGLGGWRVNGRHAARIPISAPDAIRLSGLICVFGRLRSRCNPLIRSVYLSRISPKKGSIVAPSAIIPRPHPDRHSTSPWLETGRPGRMAAGGIILILPLSACRNAAFQSIRIVP